MEEAGDPQEAIDAAKAGEWGADNDYLLLPENASACAVFLGMSTRWDRSGIDRKLEGLKYNEIPTVMEGLEIEERFPVIFQKLRVMEAAVLVELRTRE